MIVTARIAIVSLILLAPAPALAASRPSALYERAMDREQTVRAALAQPAAGAGVMAQVRRVISAYERIVRLYPRSGYCDNALWQAAALASNLWAQFGEDVDRQLAIRLYRALARSYPTSSFVPRAKAAAARLEAEVPRAPVVRASNLAASGATAGTTPPSQSVPAVAKALPSAAASSLAVIRDIRRTVLPDVVRVTVELDREVAFHQERIGDPDRVFLDLRRAKSSGEVRPSQEFDAGFVKRIRLGQRGEDTVRVVLDMNGNPRYSVFALYSPYRVVIDCERPVRVAAADVPKTTVPSTSDLATKGGGQPAIAPPTGNAVEALPSAVQIVDEVPVIPRRDAPPPPLASPPSANLRGRFSLSRQLGLGVARIVIDPGHGGTDPGAGAKGLTESALVLDVALRLEALLQKQPGVEVVLTRRTDVFIPLEERTAIANREDADLFLSIHANASRNRKARGIETYFLNFASNPDAEAVAARENAASGQRMHKLPDIVRAITLNNKLDESRDFATFVQRAMVGRLRQADKAVRDLGVKQAPFVVLIGAGMPSILAEISFITHADEGRLLKTAAYRQRIAEALLAGVLKYQRALKSTQTVAQVD